MRPSTPRPINTMLFLSPSSCFHLPPRPTTLYRSRSRSVVSLISRPHAKQKQAQSSSHLSRSARDLELLLFASDSHQTTNKPFPVKTSSRDADASWEPPPVHRSPWVPNHCVASTRPALGTPDSTHDPSRVAPSSTWSAAGELQRPNYWIATSLSGK
jgi:hypothetical protein